VKAAARFSIVLVTAPNLNVARQLVRRALRAKLVACANIIPKIESHYWWQGKVTSDAELLIVFKTAKATLGVFEAFVRENHPYDTPEFIALPIASGSKRYLDWIAASLK
jgi:periplasmic divalent cation tolerance protein